MKLSFSTRGWKDMTWDEWVEAAVDMHFNGIEIYSPFKRPELLARGGQLHKYSVAATVRDLRSRNLEIPCFDTYLDLSSSDPQVLETLEQLIALASDARVPYVSAFASQETPQVEATLEALIPCCAKAGVTLLVKTSFAFANTANLREMLNRFACDELGALWDVHHPVRDAGEMPAKTIENLGAYVKHVHLRDSSVDEATGEMSYEIIGEGTLPIEDVIRALRSIDYDGFISLEWKPKWMDDLDDPQIIFPYFVNYMARYDAGRDKRRMTIPNHDGSGQYVWEKFELINHTFPEVLDIMAETFPDQYCFKYTTLDYTRTYSQFRDDVNTFARALVSLGVKPGSKVAIWAGNVPAWYITFWATVKIGAVLVTVNSAYKIHEADYLLRQSDTHTLVMTEGSLDSNYGEIMNGLCPEIAAAKPGDPLHCQKLPFLRNV
ncbi:MAG: AMP-binding protein, partial [Coriobacteriales bacterium]|nr:AMP-binding protein [Coriobacteriales bacterium]